MKFFKYTLFSLLFVAFSACELDEIDDILNENDLSDEEIAQGLKEALIVGTDTATAQLGQQGGYLDDPVVRILLPPNLRNSIDDFRSQSLSLGFVTVTGEQLYSGTNVLGVSIPGLKSQEDELVEGINEAASEAAGVAAPIFVDAITGITIADANNILFGGVDTAATAYLRQNTGGQLYNEYEPKIDEALNSVKIGNNSVVKEYEDFVQQYNSVLSTDIPGFGTLGSLMNLNAVNATDLSAYSTNEGLDGLYLKISEEEKDIREDPLARVSSLLESVFGQLD